MPLAKKVNSPKVSRFDPFSKVILCLIAALLVAITISWLSSCRTVKPPAIKYPLFPTTDSLRRLVSKWEEKNDTVIAYTSLFKKQPLIPIDTNEIDSLGLEMIMLPLNRDQNYQEGDVCKFGRWEYLCVKNCRTVMVQTWLRKTDKD